MKNSFYLWTENFIILLKKSLSNYEEIMKNYWGSRLIKIRENEEVKLL